MTPHLSPRTIREWLDLIPFDRARKEAIENTPTGKSKEIELNLIDALECAFVWRTTKQGFKYWNSVEKSLKRMEQSVKLKQKDHGASFGMGY